MNKKYMDPELQVTLFDSADVITASFEGEEDNFEEEGGNFPNLTPVN